MFSTLVVLGGSGVERFRRVGRAPFLSCSTGSTAFGARLRFVPGRRNFSCSLFTSLYGFTNVRSLKYAKRQRRSRVLRNVHNAGRINTLAAFMRSVEGCGASATPPPVSPIQTGRSGLGYALRSPLFFGGRTGGRAEGALPAATRLRAPRPRRLLASAASVARRAGRGWAAPPGRSGGKTSEMRRNLGRARESQFTRLDTPIKRNKGVPLVGRAAQFMNTWPGTMRAALPLVARAPFVFLLQNAAALRASFLGISRDGRDGSRRDAVIAMLARPVEGAQVATPSSSCTLPNRRFPRALIAVAWQNWQHDE